MNEQQHVYTVHLINEWTYEMLDESIKMVTCDREQAISHAESLVQAPRELSCYDTKTVIVRETLLGVATAPKEIFREVVQWSDNGDVLPLFSDDDIQEHPVTNEEQKLDSMLVDIEHRASLRSLSGAFATLNLSSLQNC